MNVKNEEVCRRLFYKWKRLEYDLQSISVIVQNSGCSFNKEIQLEWFKECNKLISNIKDARDDTLEYLKSN